MIIRDSKHNVEDVAEQERINQASHMARICVAFDKKTPGWFIKSQGSRYPRLHELKSHHFNGRIK